VKINWQNISSREMHSHKSAELLMIKSKNLWKNLKIVLKQSLCLQLGSN
jgi:hypothetical protein